LQHKSFGDLNTLITEQRQCQAEDFLLFKNWKINAYNEKRHRSSKNVVKTENWCKYKKEN